MHFYLPRRHRRKPLFPPGLLALAGLGYVVVGSLQEKLKLRNVLQLMMPELHCCKDVLSIPGMLEETGKIESFRPWRTLEFTGNARLALLQQAKITEAVRAITADSTHEGGVRIRFTPATRYSSLVFALNPMHEHAVRKWWLDITRSPTALYAITDSYQFKTNNARTNIETAPAPVFLNDVIHPRTNSAEKKTMNSKIAFRQLKWLQPLQQPEWRASMWLLAPIATFRCGRSVRAWQAA